MITTGSSDVLVLPISGFCPIFALLSCCHAVKLVVNTDELASILGCVYLYLFFGLCLWP